MSHAPRRQAAILGLFITLGIGIFVAALLTVGGLRERLRPKIEVTARFAQVDGLQRGDAVWYSGVPVGTVQEVRFAGGQQVEVELAVEEEASRHIPGDARAKIGADGLIGNTLVVLQGGSSGAPPLQDGALLQSDAAVSAEQLMEGLQQTNGNLLEITEDIRLVTSQIADGEGSIARLIHDEVLYDDIQAAVGDLRQASAEARTMTSNLAVFTQELNQPGQLPHDIVNDRQTYAKLTASVDSVQQTAQDASSLVADIEQQAREADSPLGVLLNDESAGGDLSSSLDNLETSTALLSENLEAMQHHWLFRGAVRKMKKRQQEALEERWERARLDAAADAAPAQE